MMHGARFSSLLWDAIGVTLLIISVLVGRALLEALASQWDILTDGSVMAWGMAMAMCQGTFLLLVIFSLLYAIGQFRRRRLISTIPLIANVAIFLVAAFYPFTTRWLDSRFEEQLSEYASVIQLIQEGTLEVESTDQVVNLPAELAHLSAGGGEILVDTSDGVVRVFFFTFKGLLDNYSGFMYRSDTSSPPEHDVLGDWVEIRQMRPHWFFVASE